MGLRSARAKRRFMVSVIALVAVSGASAASAVTMTIGSASLGAPGPVDIPVTVADTAGLLGIAVSFTYNSAVATATQVSGVMGVTNNCTIVPSLSTPGMVVITAACPSGIPAGTNKNLFIVSFNATTNGSSPFAFAQTPEVPNGCFLNEGTPSCEPVGGLLTVGPVVATATATATAVSTATATNTTVPVTATASATRTGTATNTVAVATATASSTPTITFTNTAGPSPTPSETRTTTATLTPSSTATVTSTPISTNTFTATFTQSPTPTQTDTRTVTPTRTITNTPNATQTRPPIPVVPSPASPAGVLMIVALGGGLIWALRRVSKSR